MMTIPIRPHHGMCYAFFRGEGYSNSFTAHMYEVQQELKKNPEIELLLDADKVCKACPNLQNGLCSTPEKVLGYDEKVLSLCGLTAGAVLPWKDFSEMVKEKILIPGKRESICGDCQWSSLCK